MKFLVPMKQKLPLCCQVQLITSRMNLYLWNLNSCLLTLGFLVFNGPRSGIGHGKELWFCRFPSENCRASAAAGEVDFGSFEEHAATRTDQMDHEQNIVLVAHIWSYCIYIVVAWFLWWWFHPNVQCGQGSYNIKKPVSAVHILLRLGGLYRLTHGMRLRMFGHGPWWMNRGPLVWKYDYICQEFEDWWIRGPAVRMIRFELKLLWISKHSSWLKLSKKNHGGYFTAFFQVTF